MDGHRYTALFEAPGGEPILEAYPDPLTHDNPWTIGLGHTGPEVKKGVRWTRDQCLHAYGNDYQIAESGAAHITGSGCWAVLNAPRRAVLTDMAFQMGVVGLAKFRRMIAAIKIADWEEAKTQMLDSEYAKHDTPSRARKNSIVLATGYWPQAGEVMV